MRRTTPLHPTEALYERTANSEHAWPIALNIIVPDFTATALEQKWGVAILYVRKPEGWLNLPVTIRLMCRRVRRLGRR